MREECKHFKGRRQDLCEGRGLNGRLTPPQHAVDHFRKSKGLEPIVVTETNFTRVSPHRQRPAQVSRIGSRLEKMFADEWGAVPCGDCKRAILKLNAMTVEQVRSLRSSVVRDISSRASKAVPQWWAKVLTSADQFLHIGGTEYMIGRYVDRACLEEESGAVG
jgi:hypothetical protein